MTILPAGRSNPGPSIRSLTVREFRSWKNISLKTDPGPVVLTGANGAGKTNLLEAVSFLAPGRGFTGAKYEDLYRRGAEGPWTVVADVVTGGTTVRIGTGAAGEGATRGRLVRIDGENRKSPSALAEIVPMIWLTPAMDGLFRESAHRRRRFFDRMVCVHDPLHARRTGAYERAMRERLRLLREDSQDFAWLAALEETMAETGTAVAAARREYRDILAPVLASGIAPFPEASLALSGTVEAWIDEMPAVDAEMRFREHLASGRRRDAEHGTTGDGPHRLDLVVTHLDTGMEAPLCSTGQQKILVIAILLASARLGILRQPPILLLDDVVAHLDRSARESLFCLLIDLGVQAWMTGTDEGEFEALGYHAGFFRISGDSARPRAGMEAA